jgi:hypothetical protein
MQASFGVDVRIISNVAKGTARGMTGDKMRNCIVIT